MYPRPPTVFACSPQAVAARLTDERGSVGPKQMLGLGENRQRVSRAVQGLSSTRLQGARDGTAVLEAQASIQVRSQLLVGWRDGWDGDVDARVERRDRSAAAPNPKR